MQASGSRGVFVTEPGAGPPRGGGWFPPPRGCSTSHPEEKSLWKGRTSPQEGGIMDETHILEISL